MPTRRIRPCRILKIMIRKYIDKNAVSASPEDSDDLMSLRRVIKPGDRITGDTIRTIKQEKEYSRPDKGQRVKIRIALNVEKVSLDDVLDRLRVGGTIIESNNESIPHGTHHSLVVRINDRITISKKRWSEIEQKLINSRGDQENFVLLAIDTACCGIARLRGTHLESLPNIYSGAGGKRYKTDFNIEKFFEQVRRALLHAVGKDGTVIIFGPGETKRRLQNFLQKGDTYSMHIAEGIDSGGEDGIHVFTKSQAMRDIMSDSKLARVSHIIDEIMMLANKKSKRFTMGLEETARADEAGAIKLLVFSDKSIQTYDEEKVIRLLNGAEGKGAETFGVDSSTDLGLRITGLGGIVSILRYSIDT